MGIAATRTTGVTQTPSAAPVATPTPYDIGTPGTPWGPMERAAWLQRQQRHRSHMEEVVTPLLAALPAQAELLSYGELDYTRLGLGRYPLHAVRSRQWQAERPTVLVTGGVHGYETSGVQGALQWIRDDFTRAAERFNLLVLPCISPWGYETINRWNPDALDPNRQFKPGSPAAESALAMACVAAQAHAVGCMHLRARTGQRERSAQVSERPTACTGRGNADDDGAPVVPQECGELLGG